MIDIKSPADLARVRRLALHAQGLLQSKPFGSGINGARAAIQHLGYVQIDTISVVERAHHHVFHSRVPKFHPSMTNQLLKDRDVFEYWAHAAAFLPMSDYRFSLLYKHAIKSGQTHWFKTRDAKLMRELLARIKTDGPLRSRDVDDGATKREGWWDWKPAKKALELLYMEGALMVSDREGFQKTYDLTERVLPAHTDTKMPSLDEFAAHLVGQQLRAHGFVSLKSVTHQRRNPELRRAVKALLDEGVTREGTLENVRLPSGDTFFVEKGALERPSPRVSDRVVILSPFDNAVIQRDRLRALFQFEYQIECYVPEAKRKYGYFSLPLLYQDAFIGRMDCKAHRKDRHFEIKSLHAEPGAFDDDQSISAFAKAVTEFCAFQDCDTVSLTATRPRQLTKRLRAALAQACE